MAAAVHIGNNGAEKSVVWLVSELRSDNYRRIISALIITVRTIAQNTALMMAKELQRH
jgi:hypothetical protein